MDKYPAKEIYLIQFTDEEHPMVIHFFVGKGCDFSIAEDLFSKISLDLLLKIRAKVRFLLEDTYPDFCRYGWGAVKIQSLSFRRDMARQPKLLPLEVEMIDDLTQATPEPQDSGFYQSVVDAINKLSPKLKAIAALAWQNEYETPLSYHEMATILGISEEGVKKNLQRARKQLKDMLSHEAQDMIKSKGELL